MKIFCPQCFTECQFNPASGESTCCGKPAFVGCSKCNARLVTLAMISVVRHIQPVLCYRCWRKAEDSKKPRSMRTVRKVVPI